MNLLIVEDDKATIQTYSDNIESFNRKSDIKITFEIIETLEKAKLSLKTTNYDAAIVDLKLSSNTTDLEGVQIVDEITQNLRFPVFVVSGSIARFEKEENTLFKKKSRDTNFKEILQEIVDIYKTGITQILGSKGLIEKHLNSIFWNHLSKSMDIWLIDETRNPEEKQRTLLRYILLHFQEYLELNEDLGFDHFHPSEIYITPVIKPNVFTGDIVIDNETHTSYIVLTPSCDLAQAKARDILLVEIEKFDTGLINQHKNIARNSKSSQEQINESSDILKKIICNSYSNKYHFLPDYKHINGGVINFQKLKTVRAQNFNNQFQRVSALNQSFAKDIVARFSYYYSRQGSPDFNTDELYKKILEN